jgi:hypothetical protein
MLLYIRSMDPERVRMSNIREFGTKGPNIHVFAFSVKQKESSSFDIKITVESSIRE